MTPDTTGGRPPQGGRPSAWTTLLDDLMQVDQLPPLDAAARCVALVEIAPALLAARRGAAYLTEMRTTGETQQQLADRIGINRSRVANALHHARAAGLDPHHQPRSPRHT